MDIAGVLAEARQWVVQFGWSKLEVFGLFFLILLFWRLPLILKHRAEIRAIELEFQRRSKVLDAKIEKERNRRSRRKGS